MNWNKIVHKDFVINKAIDNYLIKVGFKKTSIKNIIRLKDYMDKDCHFNKENIDFEQVYFSLFKPIKVERNWCKEEYLLVNNNTLKYFICEYISDTKFSHPEIKLYKNINIENKEIFSSVKDFDNFMNSFDFLQK